MDLISDLESIYLINESEYADIISIYSDSGNEDLDRTLKLKKLSLKDESNSIKALIRLINFISDIATDTRKFNETLSDIESTVERISENNPNALSGWMKIKSSIPQLTGYFLRKKIEKIKDRYSRIKSFQITTDVRPVFDIRKENIETCIYPYILKIETTDEKSFLCEFYDDTLDELIEELQLAKSKTEIIKKKLSNDSNQ